jgi:signal transduction histidine kinase/TPR repeat protein
MPQDMTILTKISWLSCFHLTAALLTAVFNPAFIYSQTARIDSLIRRIEISTGREKAASMNELAWALHNHDPQRGLEYAGRACSLWQSLHNLSGESEALLYQGICYNTLNNNEKAIEFYLRSLRLKEILKDEKGISAILNNLGNIYKEIRDYQRALAAYKRCLTSSQKQSNAKIQATAMSNIAVIYKLQGDFTSAVSWNEKALSLRESIDDQRGISASLNNLATIYADSAFSGKDLSKAMEFIRRAVTIKEQTGDRYGLSQSLINLGQMCRETAHDREAWQYLQKALKLSQELKAIGITISCYQALAELSAGNGRYHEAWEFSIKHNKLRDSVYTMESSRKIAELQVRYETEKRDRENQLLKQMTEIQDLQLNKQRTQRNFLLIFTILILLLSIAIYSRFLLKKRTNKILEEKNVELSLLNATKDKFFSIVAHDLKNPFSVLLNVTHTLRDRYDELEEPRRSTSISLISGAVDQIHHLLENLLHWSVSQSGRLTVNPEPILLRDLVENTFQLLKLPAGKKGITLDNHVENPATVIADRNMISLVFRNLLTNAVKFMEQSGKVTVSATPQDGVVHIFISDEGPGMSKEEISMLFRIDVNHTVIGRSNEKGSGLGLILCHEFVTLNGGTIDIESDPGKGTQIHLKLKSSSPVS